MKNIISIIIIAVFALIAVESIAIAEDVMMPITVKTISDGVDKNGQCFKRIGFDESASLNGIKYVKSSIIMVFGDSLPQIESVKIGDKVKLIVNKSDYKGRNSYALIALVK